LSHVSYSLEDKAVDLYLLERNFISSHPTIQDEFTFILTGYMSNCSKSATMSKKLMEGNLSEVLMFQ